MNIEMTRIDVELMLHALRPIPLCKDTTDRMEYALGLNDSLDESSCCKNNEAFEPIQPVAIDPQLQIRLLEIVVSVPFRLNEKVVMFPAGSLSRPNVRKTYRAWLAAAACAAIGGIAALMLPQQPKGEAGLASSMPTQEFAKNIRASNIVTTSFGSELELAEDRGVIWSKDHQPMRMLRVELQDRVLVRDQHGVERMLNLPREEVILIPEKLD
jgi:hypothetical protein